MTSLRERVRKHLAGRHNQLDHDPTQTPGPSSQPAGTEISLEHFRALVREAGDNIDRPTSRMARDITKIVRALRSDAGQRVLIITGRDENTVTVNVFDRMTNRRLYWDGIKFDRPKSRPVRQVPNLSQLNSIYTKPGTRPDGVYVRKQK